MFLKLFEAERLLIDITKKSLFFSANNNGKLPSPAIIQLFTNYLTPDGQLIYENYHLKNSKFH